MLTLNPDERSLVESRVNTYQLLGPGRIWLKPWQRELTRLYVGPQDQALQIEEVRSVENIPLTITARALYQVDPALFTEALLPRLPRLNDGVWPRIVKWRTEYVLRQLLANYLWTELGRETIHNRLERQVTQTLADQLSVVGLSLISVSLVKIELPATLQQTIIQAERDSLEPRGRVQVLKEYFEIFGSNLAQAMPYIVQWELLNTLHKNDGVQVLMTSSVLSPDKQPAGVEPLFQLQLPMPQGSK